MSETRIVLLYSTNIEGSNIMKWASEAGLTGRSYVWIATQSVIGESTEGSPELPAGMLGEWSLFFISTNWFSDYSWENQTIGCSWVFSSSSPESDSSRIHVKYILLRCFFFFLEKQVSVLILLCRTSFPKYPTRWWYLRMVPNPLLRIPKIARIRWCPICLVTVRVIKLNLKKRDGL